MNLVILSGYLAADPELRYTDGGTAVANARLATDESYTRDGERVENTEYHELVIWGKKGEVWEEYLSKGRFVQVTRGKLETHEWTDNDGNNRYDKRINVLEFEFGPRVDRDDSDDSPPTEQPAGDPSEEEEDIFEPDDELPF
jgi:single-strand DNA-binding protein